jgi:hypothetical protein
MNTTSARSRKLVMALCGATVSLGSGCGTINNGSYGVPVDAGNRPLAAAAPPQLLVSASEAPSYSTTYLGLVEVTFENRTAVWKQVDRVALDFGGPAKNQSVTIASGDDIDAWERAIKFRCVILATCANRTTLAPTAIETMGLGFSFDTLGAWVGQHGQRAVTTSAAGAPEASTVATPSYPDQHLLTTPFRIPPGLFTKRWILLSTPANPPGGCIDSMVLSYETSDHETGRVRLPFKAAASEWQPACMSPYPAHAM